MHVVSLTVPKVSAYRFSLLRFVLWDPHFNIPTNLITTWFLVVGLVQTRSKLLLIIYSCISPNTESCQQHALHRSLDNEFYFGNASTQAFCPSRSAKTATTDKELFEKAEHIEFSFQPTEERREVGLREVERMHRVVQRFRRNSHAPLGPHIRQLNPATRRPFPTLVETIQ